MIYSVVVKFECDMTRTYKTRAKHGVMRDEQIGVPKYYYYRYHITIVL